MRTRRFALAIAVLALLPTGARSGGECPYNTQECLDYMANKMKDSGWVGVELENAEKGSGMVVTAVVEGSPAEAAGIQSGDILVSINGIPLNKDNEPALAKAREAWKPGSEVTWAMTRGASPRDLQITLGRMPADVLARFIGQHMLEHAEMEVASQS
jgi:C-terminal processing protease CtpA/Prc